MTDWNSPELSTDCPPTDDSSECTSLGVDESIAKMIAREAGVQVQVFETDSNGQILTINHRTSISVIRSLVAKAVHDPTEVHSEPSNRDQTLCQAIALPMGSVAVWESETAQAERIGRHVRAIVELEVIRCESKQLTAEVESLTNQVMHDFEELSLIRSLATNLELPQSAEDIDAFVLASLVPLHGGVGAVSITAVLVEESKSRRKPLWVGPRLAEDRAIYDLIDVFADEVHGQPIVRNRYVGKEHCGTDGLNEMVMVECSSEGRLHGWVIACNRDTTDVDDVPWAQLGFTTVQASLMETATNQLAAQLNNIRLLRQKEELFTDVIRALVNAVEARDPYTCGHSERVASFARCLASKIGFSSVECERIYLTGLLHDVGKIAIPDGVLQKPNRLNDEERAIIETHTDSGWRILQELEALQDVLPGVLYHHESWNGKGYPDKLAGENIPIDGRILAVCDAFDAMTSDRPYRKGMAIERAMGILRDGAGEHWDPKLISVFERHLSEIDQIRVNHSPRQPAARPAPVDGLPVIGAPGISVPG